MYSGKIAVPPGGGGIRKPRERNSKRLLGSVPESIMTPCEISSEKKTFYPDAKLGLTLSDVKVANASRLMGFLIHELNYHF
jgi:hypothetical protein